MVNLFKSKFPDARADLKPWANDEDTRELIDPDSIDVGFHLPGWSRSFQSRSILVQVRFYADPLERSYRAIGIELAGFDHNGKQWQLSTVQDWTITGATEPTNDIAQKLKQFCQDVFELFNSSQVE
nr:hypothetical protein [Oculatella sp. LEGE 06141]